ncbi:MAG: hypothetical protein AAF196_13300 [Planctomycetota bacterium]
MAARKRDTASKGRSGGKARGGAPKQKKAKKAEVAIVDEDGVEVVEGAMTFEDAILVGTGIVLLIAVIAVAMISGDSYPEGGVGTYADWLKNQ